LRDVTRVLVVASDSAVGDPVRWQLESSGFDVVRCWGPRPPDFVCAGVRCSRCALAERADVIVLDGWLASDVERMGVPSWHLLRFYRDLGIPVVALLGPDGLPGPLNDPVVSTLDRDADPAEVVRAVAALSLSHQEEVCR
jgi:hypothetical protein